MLIIPFLDAEATEHGFLVSDGLVMANTGRESSYDDAHTALAHIGLDRWSEEQRPSEHLGTCKFVATLS